MREVTPENAAAYLRETGRLPAGCAVKVVALGWGVSNIVMRVDSEGRPPLVLKQSRERLRTQALWISRLDRIWIERDALQLLGRLLPNGTVPDLVFADDENYLIAMTCAPDDSVVWKEQLLAGETNSAVARSAGTILGTVHADSVGDSALGGRLADTLVFDQLRIDPYYRTVARAHPDLGPRIDRLIDSMATAPDRTFVHGDFSPKNMLVHSGGSGLMLVDFETAHAGDPAFDLGFFLSHLLLKAFRAAPGHEPYLDLTRQFWERYCERAGIAPTNDRIGRAIAHTAGCALARIDGKSPVEYLDAKAQMAVRRFARAGLGAEFRAWESLLDLAVREMQAATSGQGLSGGP